MPVFQLVNEASDIESICANHLQQGDFASTLNLLMTHYGKEVFQYCRQFLNDDDPAQEVHQLTFVQAYEGLSCFSGKSTFKTWLYSIARHRCLDYVKAKRRIQARVVQAEVDLDGISDHVNTTENACDENLLVVALDYCMQRLKPTERNCVLLHHKAGFTFQEMADICLENKSQLQMRVARALPKLRKCLERKGVAKW